MNCRIRDSNKILKQDMQARRYTVQGEDSKVNRYVKWNFFSRSFIKYHRVAHGLDDP